MKLKAFKEKDKKKIGILLFTITCILLITGAILYKTFAIFETNNIFNVVNETIEDEGNIRFMVYVNNELQKSVPDKSSGYSLDTSESHCENGSFVSWNDENWSVEIKGVSTTKTKCYLYFKEIYQEKILNGAIPNLGNGRLIPITISENELPSGVNYQGTSVGGKVYKADITNKEKPWYSYEQKKWANAVILKDGETDHYKPNEEIPESVIESYFVWIPRYRYQLKESESEYDKYTTLENLGIVEDSKTIPNKASPYEITFETKDQGIQNGNTLNSWLTHPAFTSFNSNGMWVGKFETGYNGAINTQDAEKDERDISKIIIKPNVYSWRGIKIGTAFYNSYDYQRELESHMMKNTEWGAVFYLTYSIYGRCDSTSCEEVRINNNENYVTGYSASKEPTCGPTGTNEDCNIYESVGLTQDGEHGYNYYNKASVESSTTGNYSGIYDMSGSAWEFMMGVMQASTNDARPATGSASSANSGFKGPYSNENGEKSEGLEWPSSLYYDLYQFSASNLQYQRGKLGDGTKELGPFYSVKYIDKDKPTRYVSSYFANQSYFIDSGEPWFVRGAGFNYGIGAGLGAFSNSRGLVSSDGSFRLVLMS